MLPLIPDRSLFRYLILFFILSNCLCTVPVSADSTYCLSYDEVSGTEPDDWSEDPAIMRPDMATAIKTTRGSSRSSQPKASSSPIVCREISTGGLGLPVTSRSERMRASATFTRSFGVLSPQIRKVTICSHVPSLYLRFGKPRAWSSDPEAATATG